MWELLDQHWRHGVEIMILGVLLYHGYLFFRATRGARILTGLVVLLLSLTIISDFLQLKVLTWLMGQLGAFVAIGLVIIFQPELRRMLAELGSQRLFNFNQTDDESLDTLIQAMEELSHKRVGALIAIRRGIDLAQYAESGVELDAEITTELINTIFHPKTPLHDGGAIVEQGRISHAGCVFPVSQREVRDRAVGLRHRAAMGITEETDAIALIVSEETGALSMCFKGRLNHDRDANEIRQKVAAILSDGELDTEDEASAPEMQATSGGSAWAQGLRVRLTRHWKEKLIALVLAFFFWNMVKQQIRTMPRNNNTDIIRDHSIQDAAGFSR